jgi:hypothetical protein
MAQYRDRGFGEGFMRYCGLMILWLFSASVAWAEKPTSAPAAKPVDGIRDNSFFIEEAYNQEAGVVQHIFNAQFGTDGEGTKHTRGWDLLFTQEWPLFSQAHQLSYSIPYSFLGGEGEHDSAIGDAMLNYRYQLFNEKGLLPAISPRLSLILPTGDEDRGFGTGVVGYQFNLPFSKTLTDRMYANFNIGMTYFPAADLRLSNGRHDGGFNLIDFNLGGSLIYAITKDFNVLFEAVWNSQEGLSERTLGQRVAAVRERNDEVILSPGVRWAINLPGDLQIVPGIALPVSISSDNTDYGIFFYLSIEHPFLPNRE